MSLSAAFPAFRPLGFKSNIPATDDHRNITGLGVEGCVKVNAREGLGSDRTVIEFNDGGGNGSLIEGGRLLG
ncbi:hypothetical protein V6N12_066751 [Hibiscus sabdariffa]|uniref:Uncharacterized protein n=1 Tax=Hibiscus sabdariffa TaxID=183260 RepID=A0ABR2BDK9_9ROSI